MIFKSKKQQFFLTIDSPETVTEPAAATPVAAEPTPVVAEPAPAPKATVKATTQKSPEPVAEPAPVVTPAAIVEESPYAFFPSRRTPGPSLTMFMNMARDMRR